MFADIGSCRPVLTWVDSERLFHEEPLNASVRLSKLPTPWFRMFHLDPSDGSHYDEMEGFQEIGSYMNIKGIAKIAKVNYSTVSRALRNSPAVKPSTRERILEIARDHHYVPNEIARSLKTKSTKIIGLIVSDITNPFFTEIINATEAHLAKNSYSIILCNTNYSVQKEQRFLEILFSRGVEGIIISPTSLEHLHTVFFERYELPNVLLDVKCRNLATNSVYVDQELGAFTAVKYLFTKGHRKIAFLAGPDTMSSSQQAIKGYLKAHRRMDLSPDMDLISRIPQDYDAAYAETRKLLKAGRRKKITAIFSLSDYMCIGIYRALEEENLRIPDDMAVMGYDGLTLTRFLRPSLTTVRQPNAAIGNKAAEMILRNIRDRAGWKPRTVVLKPELIVGESV
jgi:LacI family transcriptional regulator